MIKRLLFLPVQSFVQRIKGREQLSGIGSFFLKQPIHHGTGMIRLHIHRNNARLLRPQILIQIHTDGHAF